MVEELCDFCAGCDGSIWYSTVQFHSPAILASIACGAPGVAAFVILSIIAFCSADICGGASAAWAAALTNNATITNAFWSFMGSSEGWLAKAGRLAGAVPRRRGDFSTSHRPCWAGCDALASASPGRGRCRSHVAEHGRPTRLLPRGALHP